jgi:hypothetical protein
MKFFSDVVFQVTLACTNVVGLFVNVLLLMGVGKVMTHSYNLASANLTSVMLQTAEAIQSWKLFDSLRSHHN